MGGMCKHLEHSSRKPRNFVSHPGGNLEDHNAERNMNSRNLVHQISEESKDTIGKRGKGRL